MRGRLLKPLIDTHTEVLTLANGSMYSGRRIINTGILKHSKQYNYTILEYSSCRGTLIIIIITLQDIAKDA